jgi:uncharacterized protein (TIGR03435 family)
MRVLIAIVLSCLVAIVTSQAQSPPQFEAASIKRNTSGERAFQSPRFQGTTLTARNVPLEILISRAYGVASRDLMDAPRWIFLDMTGGERYDVVAKYAEGSSALDQRAMLRNLLEDRFGLRLRRETRQLPVYFLRRLDAGGRLGPNLQPAARDCRPNTACEGQVSAGKSSYKGAQWSLIVQSIGEGLAERIVDETGLSGYFDFELTHTQGLTLAPGDFGIDLFGAVQQQLGLKLERGRAPFEVAVVEAVRRPTPD